jgi:hypothetical protein
MAAAPTGGQAPVGFGEPIADEAQEPAEAPVTGDAPTEPEEPPQLAQAPKQPNSNLPYPPPPRPWLRRRAGEPYPSPSQEAAKTIGPKVIAIPQQDGSFEVRNGGTKTWRNNNPGALKYTRDQDARADGAVGVDDDGFAIFPSYEVGKAAALGSLRKKAGMLDKAIEAWAPKTENDTARYQRFIQSQTGLSGDTRIDTLTQPQLELVYDAIKRFEGKRFEGWKVGDSPRRMKR